MNETERKKEIQIKIELIAKHFRMELISLLSIYKCHGENDSAVSFATSQVVPYNGGREKESHF